MNIKKKSSKNKENLEELEGSKKDFKSSDSISVDTEKAEKKISSKKSLELELKKGKQQVDQLKEIISNQEDKINKLEEGKLLLLASIENERKENEKEWKKNLTKITEFGNEKLLEKILFLPDNYEQVEQAFKQIDQDLKQNIKTVGEKIKNALEGHKMILEWFRRFLHEQGVEEIKIVPFEDNINNMSLEEKQNLRIEAVEENNNYPEGIVLRVFQKGYKIRQRILRPVTVEVNKKKQSKKIEE